ncbi:type II secretion system protein [Ralstonia solanacearum]|uniref:type II secretion system protein n=1 Tax=Ralstonia solanacearum TaxID=305 RepID=UPI0002D929D4|nr:type II secretion system protein [Ralstonia solanacearum]MCL9847158.1 type II secretion system GspH family protein [Ralstonia solanacearum]MDC6179317.1 type II secretion system protein [Ralstonia solanacearum]MDC6211974.1 type II secretion system protein [Ralstonia solanacearum]MDC6240893.1 type II secretion system protein [Ralstonia solanacearum]MDC6253716.1 type II secretion system protein [Ralstonia solanacearum]
MPSLPRAPRFHRASHGRGGGFTLIELVITLALVGILAMAIVPLSELAVQRQKEQDLRVALREIRTALDAYKEASDAGSIEHEAGASGYPPTLAVLVDGVKDVKDPQGRLLFFLRRVPRDPLFTGDASVQAADTWNVRAYGVPVEGGAGGDNVFDVTSKADGVGLNGIPYKDW